MKNYKQILEAINRGISLALDDFDNEEIVPQKKSKQVYDRDYTKEYLDLMNNYVVDLGLPSGTLWCKYNLGCDFDLLNNYPENTNSQDWYGNYYMWGDTNPIEVNFKTNTWNPKCNWDSYKYAEKTFDNYLTKYCNDPKYSLNGFTDKLTQLLPEDDAAYQNMHISNFKFHIPTKEQFVELKNYTKQEYIKNYKVNGKEIKGLNGVEFISKINDQKLFIPAAGYYNDLKLNNIGEYCLTWSSSLHLDNPLYAYFLNFTKDFVNPDSCYFLRYFGLSVRPVFQV